MTADMINPAVLEGKLTGFVCEWKALRRAVSVSALSSFLLISGSPVTSSLPGTLGGANLSW